MYKGNFEKKTALEVIFDWGSFYMYVDVGSISEEEIIEMFEDKVEMVTVQINHVLVGWAKENPVSKLMGGKVVFEDVK